MSAEPIIRRFLNENGYVLPKELMSFDDLKTHIRTFISKLQIENEKMTIMFGYMYWMTDDDWSDLIYFFKLKAKGRIS